MARLSESSHSFIFYFGFTTVAAANPRDTLDHN